MYITPNSIIRCLSGVPIDNTYRNTLWWNSAAEQETYFYSKSKVSLGAQSYQRANRGYLKINVPVEQLYDCNYLMFQNTSFGTKWFYAFITNVEYVNNVTTRVQYQLDVMQTWFFDYTLGTNFVSREHIAVDTIGANLIPEGLETGEYVCETTEYGSIPNSYNIIIVSTFDSNYDDVCGGLQSGLYNGCVYNQFQLTAAGALAANAFIEGAVLANKQDGILAVLVVPSWAIGYDAANPSFTDFTVPKYTGSFGGYIPKNNKLYTYPYNLLYVDNMQGTSANFRYEDFSSADCYFHMWGDMCANPSVIVIPRNYKGLVNNFNEMLTANIGVLTNYNVDAYKAYLAQSLTAYLGDKVGDLIADGYGAIAPVSGNEGPFITADTIGGNQDTFYVGNRELGSPINRAGHEFFAENLRQFGGGAALLGAAGALGGFNSIYSELSTQYAKQTQAPQNHGSNNGSVLVAKRYNGIRAYQMHIKAEFAQSIDGFFTMFGYATHQLKVPNRNSRPHWNYVQLKNTHIEGGIPFDHESAICRIYDNGITFWKNPAEVGNYALDNRPV